MNFLAHIYLSGNDEDIIIGNFIADSIKGKKYLQYPEGIQKGIILHRAIDTYTDTHPLVRKGASRLFKNYRHYSGVIIDIFYDHFLAANWKEYSDIPLDLYTEKFYALLQENRHVLPLPIQGFLPFMIRDNWLLSYATLDGIAGILKQMNQRTRYVSNMDKAIFDLEEHYPIFKSEFQEFFPELQQYSNEKILRL